MANNSGNMPERYPDCPDCGEPGRVIATSGYGSHAHYECGSHPSGEDYAARRTNQCRRIEAMRGVVEAAERQREFCPADCQHHNCRAVDVYRRATDGE